MSGTRKVGETMSDTKPRRSHRGSLHPRRRGGWLAWLVSLLLAGCGGAPEAPPEPAGRWIADDPGELLELPRIAELVEVFGWRFESPGDFEPWRITGAEGRRELEAGALVLASKSDGPRLVRRVDLDAGAVDLLDVEVGGVRSSAVRLFWAGPGESFSAERSLSLQPRAALQLRGARRYRFEVGRAGGWSGPIERLQIQPTSLPDQTVRLRSVAGSRYHLGEEALLGLVGGAWKVDRAGELRNALVAPPGLVLEHDFEVPPGGRLRFGYSLPASFPEPVTFRVSARPRTGSEGAGEPAEIFAATIDPGAVEAGWRDGEADLAPWAGETVTLLLTAEAATAVEPRYGLPAWSNPVVEAAALPGAPSGRPPNLVVVSIDTLRADHLSLYGHPRNTSPRLERWAAGAAVLKTAVAPSPWTLPSHVSLFSGLDALAHGVNYPRPAPGELSFLAEILRRRGYATSAITDGGYLHPRFGLAQGFDRYRHDLPGVGLWQRLETAVDAAVRELGSQPRDRPFFFFFHTYETHDPYLAREPYVSRFLGRDLGLERAEIFTRGLPERAEDGWRSQREFLLRHAGDPEGRPLAEAELPLAAAFYDAGVAHMDHHLGRLLDRLEELGLAEGTVVVVTSDHGEALGDHGFAGHGHLYDDNLLVPLVIAGPEVEPGRIDGQVRLIDLFPTLLELLGAPVPEGIDGVSLRSLLAGHGAPPPAAFAYNALSNHGVAVRVDDRLKYVLSDAPYLPLKAREELYRLEEDPGELIDVAATAPETEELRSRVRRRLYETHEGLRLQLFNDDGLPVSGRLRGPVFDVAAVKSPDPAAHFTRRGSRLDFELAPGEEVTLTIRNVADDPIEIGGWLRGAGEARRIPFEITLDRRELAAGPRTVACRDAGCELLGQRDPRAAVGFHLSWVGELREEGSAPAEEDADLRRRLQALGYLD